MFRPCTITQTTNTSRQTTPSRPPASSDALTTATARFVQVTIPIAVVGRAIVGEDEDEVTRTIGTNHCRNCALFWRKCPRRAPWIVSKVKRATSSADRTARCHKGQRLARCNGLRQRSRAFGHVPQVPLTSHRAAHHSRGTRAVRLFNRASPRPRVPGRRGIPQHGDRA